MNEPRPPDKPDPRESLARRVSDDDFFLSSILAAYQDAHGLDDAALAGQLGCPVAVLTSLRLCRRPGAAEPERTADDDMRVIARRFALDEEALRRVVNDTTGDA
jgi:hypothetical protein